MAAIGGFTVGLQLGREATDALDPDSTSLISDTHTRQRIVCRFRQAGAAPIQRN
jgi:hypothetical protein